jgi:hypothetical protein
MSDWPPDGQFERVEISSRHARYSVLSITVVPAEAGTQGIFWIPASAGMTACGPYKSDKKFWHLVYADSQQVCFFQSESVITGENPYIRVGWAVL